MKSQDHKTDDNLLYIQITGSFTELWSFRVSLTMPIKYCTLNLNKKTGGQEYEIFRNAL